MPIANFIAIWELPHSRQTALTAFGVNLTDHAYFLNGCRGVFVHACPSVMAQYSPEHCRTPEHRRTPEPCPTQEHWRTPEHCRTPKHRRTPEHCRTPEHRRTPEH